MEKMKKVSADKFNQVKSRFNFVKMDIELDASKDIAFYGCEISNTHVLVVGVYNSDIATCAHVTKGEIIECNGKFIIDNFDSSMTIPTNMNAKAEPVYEQYEDATEEVVSNISDDRLGAIDAVNFGEPEIPRHAIPEFEPPKEEKLSKVDELIIAQRKQNEEKPRVTIKEEKFAPKSNPIMTTGRAFDGELKSRQEPPKKESAIFKKDSKPVAPKPEPQRNRNPQTIVPEPKKVVVEPEPSDSGFGCWG
jgi:hypothetical protein